MVYKRKGIDFCAYPGCMRQDYGGNIGELQYCSEHIVDEMSVASDVTFPVGGPALGLDGGGVGTIQGPGGVILNSNTTVWAGNDIVNAPFTVGGTGSLTINAGSPQFTDTLLVESGGLFAITGIGGNALVKAKPAGVGANALNTLRNNELSKSQLTPRRRLLIL